MINYSVIVFLWFNPTYSGESFWMSKINNSTDFWYLCLKDWLLFAFIYNRRQHISHVSLKARKWREKLFWGEVLFRLERRIHWNYRQTIIENNVKFMEVFPPPHPQRKKFWCSHLLPSPLTEYNQLVSTNCRQMIRLGDFITWMEPGSKVTGRKKKKCACINEKVNRSPSDLLFSLWSCSLGNTMWLDPLVERKYLPNINVTTNALNVRVELLREKRAAENKQVRGFSALTLVWKVVGNLLFWYNIPSRVAYVGQMRKRDPLSLTVELTVLSNPDKLSAGHTGPVWKL